MSTHNICANNHALYQEIEEIYDVSLKFVFLCSAMLTGLPLACYRAKTRTKYHLGVNMINPSVNAIKHQDGQKFVTKQVSKPACCLFLRIIIRQSLSEMFRELMLL